MKTPDKPPLADAAGLPARRVAAGILDAVLRRHRPLDEQLDGKDAPGKLALLADRDRALTRRIAATALRRLGSLRWLLAELLEKGVPASAPRVEAVLLTGATQILWLDVPDHAAVDLAVKLIQSDRPSAKFSGLVNAVLRRVAREGAQRLAAVDATMLDTPAWLMARWTRAYGADIARAIGTANGNEPALDLTPAHDAQALAAQLSGRVLPTGSVRAMVHGAVPQLPGYADGAWWVQDAAAALPARLFGELRGRRVADLCAAPGGKTAQLAHAGADVTAVDRSAARLARVSQNLARLHLSAEIVTADATQWSAAPFDTVLLDAPCSATGTIRRHPDIPWLKREADVAILTALQARLLAQAITLTKPGGTIVYCTCSLEPEEGVDIVQAQLARDATLKRLPIAPGEFAGFDGFVTAAGDLRTLPCHWPDPDSGWSGLDGFYAARLQRL